MAIRIIDPDREIEITYSGEKVRVKQLNWAEQRKLGILIQKLPLEKELTQADIDEMGHLLAKHLINIDPFTLTFADVVGLSAELLKLSSLTGEEAGN